jgi:hypothetical protein
VVKLMRVKSPTRPDPDFVEVTDELVTRWEDLISQGESLTKRLQSYLKDLETEIVEDENCRNNSIK